MPNVGHTINFSNRNAILKVAFDFVDTTKCNPTGIPESNISEIKISPTFIKKGTKLIITGGEYNISEVRVFHYTGKLIYKEKFPKNTNEIGIFTGNWTNGFHIVEIESGGQRVVKKVTIY